jgi:23S rRNA-/tRNA-specific pseudouridylate synthase
VDTDDVGTPVRRFTQWIQRRLQKAPIAHSHDHRYGIIHRLDAPSSGLICVGRTFTGYYSLMHQISVGRIAREYCVLSFNPMSPSAGVVNSNIFQWKQAGPVCAHVREDVGKFATTWFSVVAHGQHTWADLSTLKFSLIAIRIGTGRRHQIRTHITHIGHPTVLDAKYADAAIFESEALSLGHHLLHTKGVQVKKQRLHSRRFKSIYPQHIGLDSEFLNPALCEMMGRATAGTRPTDTTNSGTTVSRKSSGSPLDRSKFTHHPGMWSRDGPCSKASRRIDAEGRDMDRCMVCGQFGHWSRECPNGGKERCLVCGKLGHRAKDCPEGGEKCQFCKKIGHTQEECPQLHPAGDVWKPLCFDFKSKGKCRFGKKCPFPHASGCSTGELK